ncbi:MAG: hypothetical protein HS115_00025 [Spirochaetales bacterium]|nr:hypothetical protein [Spirochaetales bacterium]
MADIINATTGLFNALVGAFGPWGAVAILVGCTGFLVYWRIRSDRQKDRDRSAALQEKERAIQRLANENREYRILMIKEKYHWTDDQINRYILKAEFNDGAESRKFLGDDK